MLSVMRRRLGRAEDKKSRVFLHWLRDLYVKDSTLRKQQRFMKFHYYIGLILKCNEIREKIRHLRKTAVRASYEKKKKKTMVRCVLSGLVPSSKIPAGLLGPHCLECRPANQFLPSIQKEESKNRP